MRMPAHAAKSKFALKELFKILLGAAIFVFWMVVMETVFFRWLHLELTGIFIAAITIKPLSKFTIEKVIMGKW